jgi:predicted negative regulator of RcsB-dependent stress response
MAAYDLEEQERIDALKDWWNKWGTFVYGAVIITLAAVLGSLAWKAWQRNQADKAEIEFKAVKTAVTEANTSKDPKKLTAAADALATNLPSTFYATEAQLLAAKATFEAGDYTAATKHLQWVVDNGRDTHRNIARMRLATVMFENQKTDDALKVLESIKDDAFVPLAADLKGDVLQALGRTDEARTAYQLAIEKSDSRSATKAFTQSKLDAIGVGAAGVQVIAGASKDATKDTAKDAKTGAAK